MTAQIGEKLTYEGTEVAMCSTPLADYFALGGRNPGFEVDCTALWRGYVGHWEISNGQLYLVGIEGVLIDGTKASLTDMFPDFPDRVFAHWYSGKIRVPLGKQLEYVHAGFASVYEGDLLLDFERGIQKATQQRLNVNSQSVSTTGSYKAGAMTVFPSNECAGEDTV